MSLPTSFSSAIVKQMCSTVFTDRGTLADMGPLLSSGAYSYNPNTLNMPDAGKYGIMLVMMSAYNYGIEAVFHDYSNVILYRIVWGGTKRPWHRIIADS